MNDRDKIAAWRISEWFKLEIAECNNSTLRLQAIKFGADNIEDAIEIAKKDLKKKGFAKSVRRGRDWRLVRIYG